jgi:adenosylmethionine-8-amino-7-oxononanoate aminotransferase
LDGALLDALRPLGEIPSVAEVRGGVGLLAAVELSQDVLTRTPDAVARVTRTARAKGVLVRGLGRGVAVSPPLTVQEQHFGLIAGAVGEGLAGL